MKRIHCIFVFAVLFAFTNGRGFANQIDILNDPSYKDTMLAKWMKNRKLAQIPYPFEELTQELRYDLYSVVGVTAPRGRSLQRKSTNEKFPRELLSSASSNQSPIKLPLGFEDYTKFEGSDYDGKLFFGHAEKDGKIEIISWNPKVFEENKTLKISFFDFLVAEKYTAKDVAAGTGPVITQPNLVDCYACHQNRGPIFTPAPWSEIIVHNADLPFYRDAKRILSLPLYTNVNVQQLFPSGNVRNLFNHQLISLRHFIDPNILTGPGRDIPVNTTQIAHPEVRHSNYSDYEVDEFLYGDVTSHPRVEFAPSSEGSTDPDYLPPVPTEADQFAAKDNMPEPNADNSSPQDSATKSAASSNASAKGTSASAAADTQTTLGAANAAGDANKPAAAPPPTQEQVDLEQEQSVRALGWYARNGIVLGLGRTSKLNSTTLHFSNSVFIANRFAQAFSVFTQFCGNDLECRRILLLLAVANINQSNYIRKPVGKDIVFGASTTELLKVDTPYFVDRLQRWIKIYWPKDEFSYISNFIPDLSSYAKGDITVEELDPRRSRADFDAIKAEYAAKYLYDVASDALGFTHEDRLKLRRYRASERIELIENVEHDGVNNLIKNWPPTAAQIIEVVASSLSGVKVEEQLARATTARQAFQKYCVACHVKNSAYPEIPFNNAAELLAYNKSHSDGVKSKLQDKLMPPPKVFNIPRPNEAEVKLMAEFFDPTVNTKLFVVDTPKSNVYGIPMAYRPNIPYSFIVGNPAVTLRMLLYVDPCLRSTKASASDKDRAVIVALDTNGRLYISPDNFPHHNLGTIKQVFAAQTNEGRCSIFALSRRGKLQQLLVNEPFLGAYGIPKYVREVSFPDHENVEFMYVGPLPENAASKLGPNYRNNSYVTSRLVPLFRHNALMGITKEGKLYRIDVLETGHAMLRPLGGTDDGPPNAIFLNGFGFDKHGNVLLKAIDGGWFYTDFYDYHNEWLRLSDEDVSKVDLVSPSLDDGTSVLVVPDKYAVRPKSLVKK